MTYQKPSDNTHTLLLTVREVSEPLRIHRPKVYDLIRDGTIEGFKLGSDWRIKRDSVERLIGPIAPEFFNKKSKKAKKGPKTDLYREEDIPGQVA